MDVLHVGVRPRNDGLGFLVQVRICNMAARAAGGVDATADPPSFGIFQEYYTSHPPFDQASSVSIAAVGTTCFALQYGESLVLSFFLSRYPDFVKVSMWSGLVLSCLSFLLSSFVQKAWQLILLQGVGVGLGGGLLYFPVVSLLSQWFVRRRGLAGGIIFAGSGVGGFVFPFILNALLVHVGFRWTLRIWALAMLVVSGIALLGVGPRIPAPRFHRGHRRPRFIPPQMQFVKTPLFWSFSATTTLQALSYFPVSLYISTYATAVSSPASATIALALFNVSSVIGRVLIGYLCDRFSYAWIMCVSGLGSGIAAFVLWGFASTVAQVFAFAIVFGSMSGGFSSAFPAAAADCAGSKPEQAGIILACAYLCKGVAAAVGPVVSSILYTSGTSSSFGSAVHYGSFGFGSVEIFVGTCAVATSLGSVLVAATRRRVQASA
ncbi:MFS general substrate transporter [Amylocystis lapponica]|nr:MFS general substrate transporter [Amylocystis lapponica]